MKRIISKFLLVCLIACTLLTLVSCGNGIISSDEMSAEEVDTLMRDISDQISAKFDYLEVEFSIKDSSGNVTRSSKMYIHKDRTIADTKDLAIIIYCEESYGAGSGRTVYSQELYKYDADTDSYVQHVNSRSDTGEFQLTSTPVDEASILLLRDGMYKSVFDALIMDADDELVNATKYLKTLRVDFKNTETEDTINLSIDRITKRIHVFTIATSDCVIEGTIEYPSTSKSEWYKSDPTPIPEFVK